MIQLFCLLFSLVFTSFSYSAQEPISPKSCADLQSPVCGSDCRDAVHINSVHYSLMNKADLEDRDCVFNEFTAVCVVISSSSLTQKQKNESVQGRIVGSTKPTGSCLKKPL